MLSFFPQDVLDEIWDLIESVSEGFPTFYLLFDFFIYACYYCDYERTEKGVRMWAGDVCKLIAALIIEHF